MEGVVAGFTQHPALDAVGKSHEYGLEDFPVRVK